MKKIFFSQSNSSFIRRIVISAILFNLLLISLAGYSLYEHRLQAEDAASTTTRNICQVMEQSITGIVKVVDQGLRTVEDEYEKPMLTALSGTAQG
jgi:hypothetical protein